MFQNSQINQIVIKWIPFTYQDNESRAARMVNTLRDKNNCWNIQYCLDEELDQVINVVIAGLLQTYIIVYH